METLFSLWRRGMYFKFERESLKGEGKQSQSSWSSETGYLASSKENRYRRPNVVVKDLHSP